MLYDSLGSALDNIANQSFYESARVTKIGDSYDVEDWNTGVDEIVRWTYEEGADVVGAIDYSRVHESYESYEFYDNAAHITYDLPAAIEALEDGVSVGFTYSIAMEDCGHDDCQETHTVGWLLIATDESD